MRATRHAPAPLGPGRRHDLPMRRSQARARAHREAAPRPVRRPPADALHVHHPRWAAPVGAATGKRLGHLLLVGSRSEYPAGRIRGGLRVAGSARPDSTIAALRAPDHRLAGQTRTTPADRTYAHRRRPHHAPVRPSPPVIDARSSAVAEAFDAYDLVPRGLSTHDADAPHGHAHAPRDEATQRRVRGAVDRRRRKPNKYTAAALARNLLASRPRDDAHLEISHPVSVGRPPTGPAAPYALTCRPPSSHTRMRHSHPRRGLPLGCYARTKQPTPSLSLTSAAYGWLPAALSVAEREPGCVLGEPAPRRARLRGAVANCPPSRSSPDPGVAVLRARVLTVVRPGSRRERSSHAPSTMIALVASSRCITARGSLVRLRCLTVAALPPKYQASASQMPSSGTTCGRPSGRTVASQ